MSKVKALDELRELSEVRMDGWLRMDTRKIADEIEAEIAERFVELPVDADGMMLEIGDKLEYRDEAMTLCGLIWDGADWYATNVFESTSWKPVRRCHHFKPRTLEDVLRECAEAYASGADVELGSTGAMFSKYADEIRELFGVDE